MEGELKARGASKRMGLVPPYSKGGQAAHATFKANPGAVPVNSRQMVELAALVSARSPDLLQAGWPLPEDAAEDYWSAHKTRHAGWMTTLEQFRSLTSHEHGTRYMPLWRRTHRTVEEILCAEVLTRVWGATLVAYDRKWGDGRLEPIVRSVMGDQLDARNHAMRLLLDVAVIPWDEAAELDGLRRRTQRWIDLLVAPLLLDHDVEHFAFDPERSTDFAEAFAVGDAGENSAIAWSVLMPSLRLVFRRLDRPAPHWQSNQRIARAIIRCFPHGLLPPGYGERTCLSRRG